MWVDSVSEGDDDVIGVVLTTTVGWEFNKGTGTSAVVNWSLVSPVVVLGSSA